jgi:Protein of unknown function (DUF2867)
MNGQSSVGFLGRTPSVSVRVRQVALPPAARRLSTLSHVDYEDAFLVDVGPSQDRTGEQWARAILEETPIVMRRSLRWGWSVLGLRLGSSRSDRSVLGWEVRRSRPGFVLLGANSRIGMPAELLFKRQQHTLLFATLVLKENLVARAVWAGVEPIHGPVVRNVLELASRRYRP